MNTKCGYTVTSQSGLFRPAYGKNYGFPTYDLREAQIDAQRMANTLNQPVNLRSSQNLLVINRFVPVAAE